MYIWLQTNYKVLTCKGICSSCHFTLVFSCIFNNKFCHLQEAKEIKGKRYIYIFYKYHGISNVAWCSRITCNIKFMFLKEAIATFYGVYYTCTCSLLNKLLLSAESTRNDNLTLLKYDILRCVCALFLHQVTIYSAHCTRELIRIF